MSRRVPRAAPRRWFHGTSLEAAEQILAVGHLTPPATLAEHYKGDKAFAPVEGLVYLTHDIKLALSYARIRSYKGRGKYGTGALLEVEPVGRCQADEDEIGAAVDFVLHDERGVAAGDQQVKSSIGHAVLEFVPASLAAKWRKSPERGLGGWSSKQKAMAGKAAIGVLPAQILQAITSQTRSVACEGARVLRAWRVERGEWDPPDGLVDEERARFPESKTAYERAVARAAERFVDERLPPLLAPARSPNPIRVKKPTVRSPLKKGQLVYHATSTPKEFDMLQGPAWVSDNKQAVEFFSNWHGHSDDDRPRIMTFEVTNRPKLAYIEDDDAWQDLLEWIEEIFGEDVVESGEIAEAICSAGGMDGWHIINNYNPGSDTMLCDPARWLRLVETQPLNPSVRYPQFQRRGNPVHMRPLSLHEVLRWRLEAARRGVSEVARSPRGFVRAYEAAGGRLERMDPWWRARREAFLARHLAQVAAHHEPLFDTAGAPTRRHLALVMWAYSPEPSRLARCMA